MIVTGYLLNWSKDEHHNVYWGRIYGDIKERWPDGTLIHTSKVQKVEEADTCFTVITLNSVYRLWKCDKAKEEEL